MPSCLSIGSNCSTLVGLVSCVGKFSDMYSDQGQYWVMFATTKSKPVQKRYAFSDKCNFGKFSLQTSLPQSSKVLRR